MSVAHRFTADHIVGSSRETPPPTGRCCPLANPYLRRQELEVQFAPLGSVRFLFQPILCLRKRSRPFHALECLVRGPRGTALESPEDLFDFFDSRGEEADLDAFCLARAFRQAADLSGIPRVAVNVRASTAAGTGFRAFALAAASHAGFPPQRVILDVELNGEPVDEKALAAGVTDLRRNGFMVCYDEKSDFASSLRLLADGPPDYLKLSGTVVRSLGSNPWNAQAIEATCSLGRALGFRVVAKGVECQRHLDLVSRHDIDLAQGRFLAAEMDRPTLEASSLEAENEAWSGLYAR